MELAEVVKAEVREALGPDNKWFCSKHFGREITNPDTLLTYYIRHGGPEEFRKRLRTTSPRPIALARKSS